MDTCSASPWAVCGTEEPQGRSTPLRRAGAGHGVWAGARRHLPARYLARGPCPHRSAQARPRQGAGGPGAPSGRGRVASPTAMSLPLRPCRPLLKAACCSRPVRVSPQKMALMCPRPLLRYRSFAILLFAPLLLLPLPITVPTRVSACGVCAGTPCPEGTHPLPAPRAEPRSCP